MLVSSVRVQRNCVDELAQGLAWHCDQATRVPLSSAAFVALVGASPGPLTEPVQARATELNFHQSVETVY